MSYLDTRQALLTKLSSASVTGVNMSLMSAGGDIAIENDFADPTGRDLWLAAYIIPATTESTGKTLASSDESRGVFQVSVFVPLNGGSYDVNQWAVIDEILYEFQYGTEAVYNDQTVEILTSTVNNGIENESWFKRDVSINYRTFNTRN
jgi:hypothetical protein